MAASLIAQNNTNTLPPMPAPVSSPAAESTPLPAPAPASTPAPETKPATPPKHKHTAAHRAVHHRTESSLLDQSVSLTPGPATVNVPELMVRGQAGLKGEVVARLYKNDSVTVLEQINLAKHEEGEPSQWAKISYPTNGHIWVDSKFVDNGVVSARKLNLRAGPGENYSVVGIVEKGTSVNVVETKGDWIKIEAPTNAYAFVAARFLTEEAAPTAVATTAPPPPEAPETQPTPPPTQTSVAPPEPIVSAPPPPPQPTVPPVRIVQHEGVVAGVNSLIAPTEYRLFDPTTQEDIDFLYPIQRDMDLSKYVNARVIVTGEEGIDQRWPNTPIIAVQSIELVDSNAVQHFSQQELTIPRDRH
jgi:hypothetical protein